MKSRLVRERRTPQEWEGFTELLREWFEEALPDWLARPRQTEYIYLHKEIIVILFRADNNIIIENSIREGSRLDVRNLLSISQAEYEAAAFSRFHDAVRTMLFEAEHIEREWGDYRWDTNDGPVRLSDITTLFNSLLMFARDPDLAKPPRGRPVRDWHDPGRGIGKLLHQHLISLGLGRIKGRGKISPKDEDSITAKLGAKIMSWAYRDSISPKAFADAMKPAKTKPLSLAEMFPNMGRIKDG